MKKWLSENWGCGCWLILNLLFISFIVLSIIGNNEKKREEANNAHLRDSIAKDSLLRIKFHDDSLKAVMNTKEYKDSVEAVRAKEREEYLKNTMVICLKDDSLFHSSTSCEWIEGCVGLHLIPLGKALNMGLEECPECEERESVYSGYLDGEYISIYDIPDED